MGIFQTVVQDNKFRPEDIPAFEQKLFFEGAKRRLAFERFVILLLLATIIATYGVLGDSTATVIGAMIIAPLMTPIMATAAGVAMGRLDRAIRSLFTVGAGVAGVIAFSWLIATLFTGVISYTGNAQIVARISPRLIDLLVALASGVAGAFAMSREDVADSLPGVAIAISLVPPLCVVGIGLAGGEWDVAQGALLLFLTNFFSILLAGGAVFSILGLSHAATVKIHGPSRRRAFALIIAGVFFIMIPLGLTSYQVTQDTLSQISATETVEAWASTEGLDVREVSVRNDEVLILTVGENEPDSFPQLVTDLEAALERPLTVHLQVVPAIEYTYP